MSFAESLMDDDFYIQYYELSGDDPFGKFDENAIKERKKNDFLRFELHTNGDDYRRWLKKRYGTEYP